ncbi:MAG: hypothetical protein HY652_07985 [Acidobacteria bacterium]|nr:hypothetical protein [Acidobacteriota bacterium]
MALNAERSAAANRAISRKTGQIAFTASETLFQRHRFPAHEQDALLTLVCAISLDQLRDAGAIRWRKAPPGPLSLRFQKEKIVPAPGGAKEVALIHEMEAEDVDAAFERAEEILDRHQVPEEEREMLFTSLPCLGFYLLQGEYIEWLRPHPFQELEKLTAGAQKTEPS